jgi:hypothetical protein
MKMYISLFCLLLSGCSLPVSSSSLQSTATTAVTETPTLPATFTPSITFTPTFTFTPTISSTPTLTFTPSISPTPTFSFPSVTVNVANLHCQFGPNKYYLHARDLHLGDTGVVWGRDAYNSWLYVMMNNLDIPCWVHKSFVDIQGDVSRLLVQQTILPGPSVLYGPPSNVQAEREGDQVIVTWDELWMTQDDDRGYFLDVWVCQAGNYVWVPFGLPDQFTTTATFTDQPGCPEPSGGKLYAVEKHGYTTPVDIPWPAP